MYTYLTSLFLTSNCNEWKENIPNFLPLISLNFTFRLIQMSNCVVGNRMQFFLRPAKSTATREHVRITATSKRVPDTNILSTLVSNASCSYQGATDKSLVILYYLLLCIPTTRKIIPFLTLWLFHHTNIKSRLKD
jgi:hypothetical protein